MSEGQGPGPGGGIGPSEGDGGNGGYPRQLYHPDGRTARVESAEDERAHEGWSRQPSEVHQRTAGTNVVMASGNDPLAILIREVLESVLDERDVGLSRAERAERRRSGASAPWTGPLAGPAPPGSPEPPGEPEPPDPQPPHRRGNRHGRHEEDAE